MYDGCRTVFCSCITAVCRNQGVFRLWSSYRRYYSTAGAGTADRRDAGGKLVCNVLVDRGTFVYLYLDMKVSKHNVVLMLVWLGGIASEAIMHFSPTIYASGARVYYLTDWMCMFIILVLAFKMPGKKWRDLYYSIVAGLGVWNLLYQVINYI